MTADITRSRKRLRAGQDDPLPRTHTGDSLIRPNFGRGQRPCITKNLLRPNQVIPERQINRLASRTRKPVKLRVRANDSRLKERRQRGRSLKDLGDSSPGASYIAYRNISSPRLRASA